MAEQWGGQLIASGGNATRGQLSALADLIAHFPSVALLPMLKRLLDDELRRYRAFRQQAEAESWQGNAANEAGMLYTNRYQQAFTAIKAPETTALMISYLPDENFGEPAALVLKVQWILANEPKDDRRSRGSVDFSRVEEMRADRAHADVQRSRGHIRGHWAARRRERNRGGEKARDQAGNPGGAPAAWRARRHYKEAFGDRAAGGTIESQFST